MPYYWVPSSFAHSTVNRCFFFSASFPQKLTASIKSKLFAEGIQLFPMCQCLPSERRIHESVCLRFPRRYLKYMHARVYYNALPTSAHWNWNWKCAEWGVCCECGTTYMAHGADQQTFLQCQCEGGDKTEGVTARVCVCMPFAICTWNALAMFMCAQTQAMQCDKWQVSKSGSQRIK